MRLKIVIIALVIVAAIVCIWRGLWGLQDIYLFPNNPALSLMVSIIIGIGILLVFRKNFLKILA